MSAPLQVAALKELKENMIPQPADLLSEIGPTAAVWYLQEVADYVLRLFAATLSVDGSEDLNPDDPPVIALQGLTEVLGALIAVNGALGLLDQPEGD